MTTKIGVLKGGLSTLTTALNAEITNIASLDTDLLTHGYTAAQLAIMNENDKIYAWRQKNALPN